MKELSLTLSHRECFGMLVPNGYNKTFFISVTLSKITTNFFSKCVVLRTLFSQPFQMPQQKHHKEVTIKYGNPF